MSGIPESFGSYPLLQAIIGIAMVAIMGLVWVRAEKKKSEAANANSAPAAEMFFGGPFNRIIELLQSICNTLKETRHDNEKVVSDLKRTNEKSQELLEKLVAAVTNMRRH